MNHYKYEDLSIGMSEAFTVTVTAAMMEAFYEITGDENPLHRSERFAMEKGFSGKVVYGMLTASFLSTLAGVYLPGENSLIESTEVKFVKPVFIGDELTIEGRISELNDTVRQMVMKICIRNQNGDKVVRGTMKIGLRDIVS